MTASKIPPDPPAPSGLAALAAAVPTRGPAPVHLWNPPYCGDIGLAIHSDGSWSYQGSPIARPALVALFASVLRKDEDGETYLVTPAEKVLVRVADAPFVAVAMGVEGDGPAQDIRLRTNLDDRVSVGEAHPLRFVRQGDGGGYKPYVRVRGRLEALLSRTVYLDLVALAEATTPPGEDLGVWSGGLRWVIA
jgi:uncharacterized protein